MMPLTPLTPTEQQAKYVEIVTVIDTFMSGNSNMVRDYKIGNREIERFELRELIEARRYYASLITPDSTIDDGGTTVGTGGFHTHEVEIC